ncbi:hypothetical protein MWH28_02055 [Natroniella sulfidigena]|uniref:hypothetical protein n=1 Tax=Natroniella sulfidigena TaxID=723921 RepID=UPI00200A82AA|nr:hypothetical protein [Natroniella sulfidigena]MCK8816147.1 hypothetical protein [Natroniella sulfidigena]
MKKSLYLLLVLLVITNIYSIALANNSSSEEEIKEQMGQLFSTIEDNDLEGYLAFFSEEYKNKKTNEHGTEIVETYDDLEGRFPNNDRIEKIQIDTKEPTVEFEEEESSYTTTLQKYIEYTNGLSFEREEEVEYIFNFDSETEQWLIVDIN